MFQHLSKVLFGIASILSIIVLSLVLVLDFLLPKDYNVIKGNELKINTTIPISAVANKNISDEEYSVTLKLMGVIPVSSAKVNVLDDYTVEVLGTPFGIKIYTDGVMVVGITEVDSDSGAISPAKIAGLQLGDLITSINGVNVLTNEEVALIIEQSSGRTLKFNVIRENQKFTVLVKPVISASSNKYKAGIWVRDSSAGIGTSTFYCPSLNVACGLGHGICDVDTGEILTINSGETVPANIVDLKKSSAGSPGELKGQFLEGSIGKILANNETGVFYSYKSNEFKNLKKLAVKQDIEIGDAKIYACIDGLTPKYYNCKIEKINHNNSINKNMVVKIIDEELLDKTGGIVQGMSGSPIIQNNKLIGAITHVFVNDPTKGYAIFAENMLKTARNSVAINEKAS